MPIDPFTESGVFQPEATAAMGEAFDAVCEELHCMTQPEAVRELVAGLVIAAASRGELNPDRLRMVALARFENMSPARLGRLRHDECSIVIGGSLPIQPHG